MTTIPVWLECSFREIISIFLNNLSHATSFLSFFTTRKTPFFQRYCVQLRLYVVSFLSLIAQFFTRNIQDTSTKLSCIICRPPEQIKFEYHDSNSLLWLDKSKKTILWVESYKGDVFGGHPSTASRTDQGELAFVRSRN